MSRQFWTEALAWSTSDGTAITNTATETIVFPNIVVPANYMQDGRVLQLIAYGRYSNVVTAVPTMRFRVRWGGVSGTVLADSGTITTLATAVTNAMWLTRIWITTRANGATGSLFATGEVTVGSNTAPSVGSATGTPADALMSSAGISTPAAVTVDLTADTALSLTATWSAANASNSIQGHNFYVIAYN
jgi:hypothetical protein